MTAPVAGSRPQVDVAALLAAHPLRELLARCGVPVADDVPTPPSGPRLHCPLPTHPAPSGPGRGSASFLAHLEAPGGGRWHCFACDTGGDGVDLVRAFSQVGFADATRLIGAGGAFPRAHDPHEALRPSSHLVGAPAGRGTPASGREQPDPARTPPERLLAALRAAWAYYRFEPLAARARHYLATRGIDPCALEARIGGPVAGHTPRRPTGLVDHLRSQGFELEELVDAGLASRYPDGQVRDFLTHRVVLPVRDGQGRVAGLIGRDVTGGARAKYLNSPTTAVYDKSRLLYRPTPLPTRSVLVVVEGPLDALAVAVAASEAGIGLHAVSPSGLALTAAHRRCLGERRPAAVLACADGDRPGQAATAKWTIELTGDGIETFAVGLPDRLDPADWLAEHGSGAIAYLLGRQPPAAGGPASVRRVHAGAVLAEEAASLDDPGAALRSVAAAGTRLLDPAARRRFAASAAQVLAAGGLGPDGWLERRVLTLAAAGDPSPVVAAGPAVGVGLR